MKKKSKQPETTPELEDGVDKISNMPDNVLQLILSLLEGTEEMIRTSILSRRWRYLWTSVPSIDIDCTRGFLDLDTNGFREFVYWVLLNKPQELDSFRLWCAIFYNMSIIRQWIHLAVLRKVKLLDLMFRPLDKESEEDIELPHCLVTYGSLEVLKLCLIGRPLNLPKIPGFSALRVLEFLQVNLFNNNTVKYFLESCPLLEDLSLLDCRAYKLVIKCPNLKNLRIETRIKGSNDEFIDYGLGLDWRYSSTLDISCPKLKFLKLTGYVATTFLFQNLYSLKKAVIHPKDLFLLEAPIVDLFARISHVEYLSISVYCIANFFTKDFGLDKPISLPNLKTLEITIGEIHICALIPFLACIQDLESLHLIIPKDNHCLDKLNLDSAVIMSILTRHLKKVEFLGFDEGKAELVLSRALLEHGNLLEEMVFSWGDEAKFHERSMETMKEVSKFHKASSTVKLTAVFAPTKANL